MLKKIGFTIAAIFIVFLTAVLPVLATPSVWNYYFVINVQDTSGVTRTNVPVLTGVSGNALNSSGYMSANGLDAQAADGTSSSLGYMVGSADFPVVIDTLPANGTVPVWLYTGVSPAATSFPFVVGNGGFVTVTDNAALEPANNFSIVANGYLNTTAGASENIVSKTNALVVNVDPSVSGTIDTSVNGNTLNAVQQFSTATNSAGARIGGTIWGYQTFTATAGTINGLGIYVYGVDGSQSTTTFMLYATSAGLPTGSALTSGTIASVTASAWNTVSCSYTLAGSTVYAIVVKMPAGTYGVNDFVWSSTAGSGAGYSNNSGSTYASLGAYIYSYETLAPLPQITGVSSGVGTLSLSETTTAGGTLTLSWTPSGGSANTSTITGVGSVPDTANNWIIDQNNVMPYVTSYVETVSGVEKLKFQPNTIVSGTTLVDRDGTQNGVITFGANSGITITYGGIVSQVTNGATAGGSGLSGFNVSPAGAPLSLLSNGSNLTGAYGNNSTIWGVVASFMGSVQTAGQIPPQSQLGFVYLGCVLVLMLVLIKNGVQSMFFIVILIIAALGFGAGVGILAGWVAIIATIIMIGLLYSFKQYG